ncbi:NXPE family member 4-like isoform X2 [Hyperolius riggenbachi]|uniref:NXPE family member 4-like isoform X2 n=1 Tax=Hyperolius riggenbachi TaxID=752182 RepID=UPI0035A33D32
MVLRVGRFSKVKIFWIVLIVFIIGISFTFHRSPVQKLPQLPSLLNRISVIKDPLTFTPAKHDELEDEVQQIFDDVNSTMLNVFFHDISETSSGAKSTATVLNYQPKYCIGDTLTVQVQMFNHAGERKAYGGDFLRARIFSPNLGAGASGRVEDFNNDRTEEAKPKCKTGIPLQFPSGYFLNNLWHTLHCDVSSFERVEKISTCLAHKMVYVKGDSTLNQWLSYFLKLLKSLQLFGSVYDAWHKTRFFADMTNKIFIHWRIHGFPFLVPVFIDVKDYADVAQQINQIGGDADTVIVITVGHHFRPLPLPFYIRRLLNIRKAIQSILLRSPDTKIIIKTENTRELDLDIERLGDPHGYIQYRLVKKIFGGLNIGMIDVWDMTVAYGSFEVHPDETVLKNQINIFLSYIC